MKILPFEHVDKKLLIRLGIFFAIAVIIFAIVIYDIFHGDISWWVALLGFLAGILVGYIVGRLLTVKWHEGKQKAVTEMDVTGFLAIGIYIAFRIGGDVILSAWLSGAALSTLSLAVLAGALFGRFLGLRTSVVKLLAARS